MPLPKDSEQRVTAAVQRAGELHLDDLTTTHSYLRGYHAIKELGSRTSYTDPTQIIALAYAAYGWMPTILKNIAADDELIKLGNFIQEAMLWHEARPTSPFNWPNDNVLRAVNNSVVGTSKLLHFAVPSLFPIWDSRIANVFSIRTQNKINSCENYKQYFLLLNEYLSEPNPWRCPSNIEKTFDDFGGSVSLLRKLEFCLFVSGGPEPGIEY
ncbi:MAG: hypothetical protein HC777_03675 [Hyphomonadaceae bacterium]|nr:hypothetical protein [Hyphomonadaceae bacterium]